MTVRIRTALLTGALVLAIVPSLSRPAHAQETAKESAKASAKAAAKSIFSEEGPVDTTWAAQLESLQHSASRLPLAALLSAMLAFRPRRRGTPKRQASVVQTQIILAVVGATVMLVVGASLARAFGIVGAAGLIRYRAKVEDPKDAGVMLTTLAVGLACGVGLYVFAAFAAVFVLVVLLVIESIDPSPYLLYDLAITAAHSKNLKGSIERMLKNRAIPFELSSTADDKVTYEVRMPPDLHTDVISQALVALDSTQQLNVKWEHRKDAKTS